MEFASKEEMLAYEKAREDYYMKFFNINTIEFYKLWLKEIFVPKYRKLNKEYNNYIGGWYKDENGIIHANDIYLVDLDKIENGALCVTRYGEFYVFYNNMWLKVGEVRHEKTF